MSIESIKEDIRILKKHNTEDEFEDKVASFIKKREKDKDKKIKKLKNMVESLKKINKIIIEEIF